jgi:hypothetical protein
MSKLFHFIMTKLDRYRLIPDRVTGADYMHRYYLFLKDRVTFPFNVTLHKIVKSDEPFLHDHPWPYMTLILKGGYFENTPEGRAWKGPGSVIRRGAEDYHWLELDNEKPVTTLFFMGRQQRDWGFLNNKNTWIQHEEFLNDR